MVRQMVCMYGMSDSVGLAHVAHRQSAFLSGPETPLQRDFSEETAKVIDEEVRKLLDRAYDEAKEILKTFRDQLEKIALELLKRETLPGDEFYALIGMRQPRKETKQAIGPLAPDNGELVDVTPR
jgi:cell division protease FtsH